MKGRSSHNGEISVMSRDSSIGNSVFIYTKCMNTNVYISKYCIVNVL